MDPSLVAVGKLIAPIFVKNFLSKSEGIFKIISSEVKQAFGDRLSSYLSKHELNYSHVKTILHRHEPVPFYDLYFPIKLERRQSINSVHTDIIDTKSVSGIFWHTNCITVTGNAGSGKSTLAKHIFLNSMKEGMGIPILIELRNLVYHNGNFQNYLKNIVFANELAKSEIIFERLLEAGKFVFLIDGFDEVKREYQSNVLMQLNYFIEKYKYNRFLLTSRPGVNLDLFPTFYNYRMKDLEGEEIYKFIEKQKLSSDSAKSVVEYLMNNKSDYLSSYLSNPLLLTLYLVTYTNNTAIPDKKSLFYRRVFEVLLREHDTATKIGYERELLTKMSQEKIEEILKLFSFITFFDNHYTFDREYIVKRLVETKVKLRAKYSHFPDFDVEHFIYDLRVSIGIWVQDEAYMSFIHRSMQEYFAAISISSVNINKKLIYEKIIKKIDFLNGKYGQNSISNISGYALTNFLSLCREVDEVPFYQYVKIPILKQLVDELNELEEKKKITLLFKVSGLECFFEKYQYYKEEGEDTGYSRFLLLSKNYINNKYHIIEELKYIFHNIDIAKYEYKIHESTQQSIYNKSKNDVQVIHRSHDLYVPFHMGVEDMSWIPDKLYKSIVEESVKVIQDLNKTIQDFEAHVANIIESDSAFIDLI